MTKHTRTFRLDQETERQIAELARRWATNASASIVRCIERIHTQEMNMDNDENPTGYGVKIYVDPHAPPFLLDESTKEFCEILTDNWTSFLEAFCELAGWTDVKIHRYQGTDEGDEQIIDGLGWAMLYVANHLQGGNDGPEYNYAADTFNPTDAANAVNNYYKSRGSEGYW